MSAQPTASVPDILQALAVAHWQGCPRVTHVKLDRWDEVELQLGDSEQAATWRRWLEAQGVTGWTPETRRSSHAGFTYDHHHLHGVWRGWKVTLLHLTEVAEDGGETP